MGEMAGEAGWSNGGDATGRLQGETGRKADCARDRRREGSRRTALGPQKHMQLT